MGCRRTGRPSFTSAFDLGFAGGWKNTAPGPPGDAGAGAGVVVAGGGGGGVWAGVV